MRTTLKRDGEETPGRGQEEPPEGVAGARRRGFKWAPGDGSRLKRAQEEKPPAPLPDRPRLAPDVHVHEPIEPGAPWLVQSGSQRYLRVAAGMAKLLTLTDGTRNAADLARELGWSAELVGEGLLRAQRGRLLEDADNKPRRDRRITFVPPLTIQFTVVRPERMLNVFRPLTARLAHRSWGIVAAALAGAGLLALVVQAQTTITALSEPISWPALLALLVVTYCGTMLHELSHGLVLSHYGGRPSRMGFMLFYLTPAFFCDVSDGWRLPRNRQRVRVALAGIATQSLIAGLAGVSSVVVALAGGPMGLRDFLLLLTVTNYVSGLFNTIPFVKLDGYLALMSHLDISHLRDRSITDARRLVARLLFGGRYERALPGVEWAPLFGLACMAFPLYVVSMAFTLWGSILESAGMVGAVLVSIALGYLSLRVYVGVAKLLAEARTAGSATWRRVTVSLAGAGVVAAALLGISVPYTVTGGFVGEQGRTVLVATGTTDRDAISPGAEVKLLSGGVVLQKQLGTGTVSSGEFVQLSVPFSAFVPVTGLDSLKVPVDGVVLDGARLAPGTTGQAVVDAGTRSLGDWLYLKYVAPFWR
ncbi:daptide biosynthesis intramembrane metalloprotease [Streptomyces acidiscabies]|uniref:daptide biosynthesis intramembrane metalloprotease n=1 Tax=Streptomyces acidiscabies TaxID=42234 RepID=UPI00073F34BC|nr:daptide biosynthesis intramembrane metalloprotease [Streptomyces acidiscabies]GAQ55212.1 putative peptide zinc metalloprotease protein [Streptomyces acidiscabies]